MKIEMKYFCFFKRKQFVLNASIRPQLGGSRDPGSDSGASPAAQLDLGAWKMEMDEEK
jgi:hypothetical protein